MGKGGPPRAPPSAVNKEELKKQAAARKAEADAEFKRLREFEAKQLEFAAQLPTCKTCSIEAVPWETAQISCHLGAGTKHTGVIAVRLDEDKAVTVRLHNSMVELVAQAVANSMGVRVAQFRMVHEGDPEYEIMSAALMRVEPRINQKEAPGQSRAVLEFVPGLAWDMALRTSMPTEEMFLAVGRLCVVDMLINNMDRVPLSLWEAELGNLTNIMVAEDGTVIGIDQQVNTIGGEEGFEEYIGRARRLATHIMRRDYAHMSVKQALAKVQHAIHVVSVVTVAPECLLALARGFREGLVSFEQCWSSGTLQASVAGAVEAAQQVKGQGPPIEAYDFGKHAADFVHRVAEALAPA